MLDLQYLELVKAQLAQFATQANFESVLTTAFGTKIEPAKIFQLRQQWLTNDFSIIPPIEILTHGELGNSNGGYAASEDKIFVSSDFLRSLRLRSVSGAVGVASPSGELSKAITGLLLEELGHKIDRFFNGNIDSDGDEGDIFSRLVSGQILSPAILAQLKAEDDRSVITVGGKSVAIENQEFNGDANNNIINGTPDDDYIYPGTGRYTIDGGAGNDILSLYGYGNNIKISYTNVNTGSITGGLNAGTTFKNIEKLYFQTGSGNNDINISAATIGSYISTGDGNDTITGGTGDDEIKVGEGKDTIDGGAGNDYLETTSNNQSNTTISYTNVNTGSITGGLNAGTTFKNIEGVVFRTGAGNDVINISAATIDSYIEAGAGNDTITGGTGNDTIYSGDGNNTITGGAGNDTIYAGTGKDTINGGAGNDWIYADDGNDTITGGTGNDILGGGAGDDTYLFNTGFGRDTIYEAGSGTDTVKFGAGLTLAKLDVNRLGDDLIFTVKGTNNTLTIKGGLGSNSGDVVEKFQFDNGATTLTKDQLTIVPYPDLSLTGTSKNIIKIGGDGKIKFTIKQDTSDRVTQIGAFKVDDLAGTINGIPPTAANYAAEALSNAKVIFNSIANAPQGFDRSQLSRIVADFKPTDLIGFYALQDNGTDGKNSPIILGTDPNNANSKATDLGNNSIDLNWHSADNRSLNIDIIAEKTTESPRLGTNSQNSTEGLALDLTQLVIPTTQVNFTVYRDAAYNNSVGFYQVLDASGAIQTSNGILNPQDAGYVQAALQAAVSTGLNLTANDRSTNNISATLDKSIYMPIVTVNGTLAEAATSQKLGQTYTSFLGANPDKANHIRLLGDNTFGFEDLNGGGDRDFNDIIIKAQVG